MTGYNSIETYFDSNTTLHYLRNTSIPGWEKVFWEKITAYTVINLTASDNTTIYDFKIGAVLTHVLPGYQSWLRFACLLECLSISSHLNVPMEVGRCPTNLIISIRKLYFIVEEGFNIFLVNC